MEKCFHCQRNRLKPDQITETANVCAPLGSTYTGAKCLDYSFHLDDQRVWRAQQNDAAIMAIHKSV